MRTETSALNERVAAVFASVRGGTSDGPLRLDSLEQAELVLALEEEFGLHLPEDVQIGSVDDAATLVGGGVRDGGGSPLREGIGHLQWLSEAILRRPLSRYYRLRVIGAEHVPASGPAVLASNHDSLLDIPFLGIFTPRPVWFMGKRELFRSGFSSWFFHVLGGFPVRRQGPDLRAVRAALEVIRRGRVLGMYPEGTRTSQLLPFFPGAAWVSLATGAPLVPVGIRGTAEAMPSGSTIPRRTHVRIEYGMPMELERESDPRARLERAREVTEDLRSAIERLLADQ